MDPDRFDALLAVLTAAPSRRAALRLLGGLGLAGLFGQTEAKKRPRKKCAKAGEAISKKRKKCCAGLGEDATGRCAPPPGGCTPGCGGPSSCGCSANQICLRSGVCQRCTVTCTGTPRACGTALQTAMNRGGTVYVCPGTYQGGFTLSAPLAGLTVIGTGEGTDPARNTILDANDLGGVLAINSGVGTVELERLRITDGNGEDLLGAGIYHGGTMLRMTECTVSGNISDVFGGGIVNDLFSTLEMTRCTVRDNHAIGLPGFGGGIYSSGMTTLADCLLEDNRAVGSGGGLYVNEKTTTLAGSTRVRDNTTKSGFGGGIFNRKTLVIAETCRVTGNTATAGNGGGIYNTDGGTVTLAGAGSSSIVVDNCRENCAGEVVDNCTETSLSC